MQGSQIAPAEWDKLWLLECQRTTNCTCTLVKGLAISVKFNLSSVGWLDFVLSIQCFPLKLWILLWAVAWLINIFGSGTVSWINYPPGRRRENTCCAFSHLRWQQKEVWVIPRLRSDLSVQVRGKTRSHQTLLSGNGHHLTVFSKRLPEMSYPVFWLHLQDDSYNLKFFVDVILPSFNSLVMIDANLQNRSWHTV